MGISGVSWELAVTSFPDRKLFGAKFFLSFFYSSSLLCYLLVSFYPDIHSGGQEDFYSIILPHHCFPYMPSGHWGAL